MDLNLPSLANLVPEAPCSMFSATRLQVYRRYVADDMVFANTLIWYYAHKQRHTENTWINRLTHIYKYILTPPVTCMQQLLVWHWMTNLLIRTYFTKVHNVFTFQNYSLVEVIYLLSKFNKTDPFLWNTKNTDKNGVNKQITHAT